MMKLPHKTRKSLLFTLGLLPIALVAAYFTALYQLEILDAVTLALLMEQMGSESGFIAVYMVQIAVYALVMGFFGHILATKLGLIRPARLEWSALKWTLPLAAIAGVLLSLDWWTFGAWIPGLREATDLTLNVPVVIASVLYGGVVEEVMLRLFMMSLMAWLGWKVFFRKAEKAPAGVIIAANVISAMLFAAGHLPATAMLFEVTPLLLLRCFLFNGGFGLFFGWLYRRFGIQYAMIGHALAHIVSKLIWFIFV